MRVWQRFDFFQTKSNFWMSSWKTSELFSNNFFKLLKILCNQYFIDKFNWWMVAFATNVVLKLLQWLHILHSYLFKRSFTLMTCNKNCVSLLSNMIWINIVVTKSQHFALQCKQKTVSWSKETSSARITYLHLMFWKCCLCNFGLCTCVWNENMYICLCVFFFLSSKPQLMK